MQEDMLVIYNTLSRKEEVFIPLSEGKVNMFVCGLTVYDDAHLGHAKNFINFSTVSRWLRRIGYKVTYAQNITDVDDKIISRAKERGIEPKELALLYEKRFLEDMERLGINNDVDMYPRSHDYIDTIRKQIQLLIDKGYAYVIEGDIYYDVSKFSDYTKLSGMKLDELGKHRIEPREGKKNPYDFSLWKAAKEGDPSWDILLNYEGKNITLTGRPGWHIEDTAMTYAIFGPQYDLHGGASELIFPHHTNEVAQAEAAFGKVPFVRYWMHAGTLNMKGIKMSKSLKNFIKIREFLEIYDAEVLKLLICSTHYRKEVEYVEELAKESDKRLRYLYAAFGIFYNMNEVERTEWDGEVNSTIDALRLEFVQAMNSDFNTPLALTRLTQTINLLRGIAGAHETLGRDAKANAVKTILELANVLGLLEKDKYKEKIPEEAKALVKKRQQLRNEKRFEESDKIRMELKDKHSIIIEDTEYGTVWYKK
jgi:cysteinyl-tRNA synthetase